MKQVVIYSVKVWLTTAIVAPVLITLLRFKRELNYLTSIYARLHHTDLHPTDRLYYKLLLRPLGKKAALDLLDLIPLGVGLYYTIRFVMNHIVPFHLYKRYITPVGILFAVLPSVLISGGIIWAFDYSYYEKIALTDIAVNSLFYIFIVVASIWFYKLKLVSQIPPN